MKKFGFISLMGNQPQRLSSHNAGWTFCLKSICSQYGKVSLLRQDDDIDDYDVLVINNGINFTEGGWNFIGGPPSTLPSLLTKLSKFNGDLYSFNARVDLGDLVTSRKELADLKDLQFPSVKLLQTNFNNEKLIIGDSHSLSIYRPGWAISRNDGKTLFGALRNEGSFIEDQLQPKTKAVHLYFGNIDIRFHIARQANPGRALTELCHSYTSFANSLMDKGIDVTIQGLIPIEDESRKIPGTGLYKGEPFFGTMDERQRCVRLFNEMMDTLSYNGYTFKQWDFQPPLQFSCMEARQSVHIRPSDYYFDEFIETFNT